MRFAYLLLCSLLVLSGCAGGGNTDTGARDTTLSMGAAIDDNDLENRIREDLLAANQRFSTADINVVSYNARILLVGRVPDQRMVEAATEVVREFRRVRLLHNELRVSAPASTNIRATDQWISVRVKGRFVLEPGFPSRQVRITTNEGIVYLMGLVSQEVGQEAERLAAGVDGVQRVVSIFDYTD
ncbi:MAG: BON domain-containing protein [Natronospirillum sp.]